ncbi:hypothetical protein DL93DRAFT_1787114 [Clavulina sp. PMI_390]|nr:hypothetical protein DL93DRAFT_1787114 [Clavulina sp. PMI_390]
MDDWDLFQKRRCILIPVSGDSVAMDVPIGIYKNQRSKYQQPSTPPPHPPLSPRRCRRTLNSNSYVAIRHRRSDFLLQKPSRWPRGDGPRVAKQLAQSLQSFNAPMPSSFASPTQTSYQAPYGSASYGASGSGTQTPTSSTSPAFWGSSAYSASYSMPAGTSTPVRSRSASRTRSTTPHRTRSNSVVSSSAITMMTPEMSDWDEMQEVEETIMLDYGSADPYTAHEQYYALEPSSSQYSTNVNPPHQPHSRSRPAFIQAQPQSQSQSSAYSPSYYPASSSSNSSTFASSDPFYLAATASLSQAAPAFPNAHHTHGSSVASSSMYMAPPAGTDGGHYPANGATNLNAGTSASSWFAPPVGFAAYAPAMTPGNRWVAASAGAQ